MADKNKKGRQGVVYSTNPDAIQPEEKEAAQTLPPARQKLRVSLDKKQRGGKVVTLVAGFSGTTEDLEALGKKLKTKCGAGGSAKDGEILVQGDYADKVRGWLMEWGYTGVK